jgi:hypothetical protein
MKTGLIIAAACALGLAVGAVVSPPHRSTPAIGTPPASADLEQDSSAASASPDATSEDAAPPLDAARDLEAPDLPEFHPVPPRDPGVRAKLTEKYSASTADEMRAAYDSLSEVLDAQRNQRMQDKTRVMDRAQLKALEDELGWLAERAHP